MRELKFRAYEETWACERGDLIQLGRKHVGDPNLSEEAALRGGTNQFKVDRTTLARAFQGSEWALRNILIGVAAGEGDGTAGLQKDKSLGTLRKEIEKAADLRPFSPPA